MEEVMLSPHRGTFKVQHIIDNHVISESYAIDDNSNKIAVPVVPDEYFFEHETIIMLTKNMRSLYPGAEKIRFNY